MNDYIILVDENGQPYLAHHGIQGQKLGVRRYQNEDGSLTEAGKSRYSTSTASRTARSLNRIERENAELKTKKAITDIKAEKAYQKGKDDKYNKLKEKSKEYGDAINAGEKLTKSIIADAEKNGITVRSLDTSRYVHNGRMVVAQTIAGVAGTLTVAAIDTYRAKTYGYEAGGFVSGKKYSASRSH